MFPETFVARACFPNVSQFCHTRNIVSRYNVCQVGERNIFVCFLPVLPPRKQLWKYVFGNICSSRMFPQCFPVLPYAKHCFQLQRLLPRSKICFCNTAETFRVSVMHEISMFPDVSQFCYERQHYVRQITERRDIHPHKALV